MLFAIMPLMVCAFWSITLALDLKASGWKRHRAYMLLFMVTATLLYMGHYVYFSHMRTLLPLTDTIYVASNLAVYPLYYLYIRALTCRKHSPWQWLALLPAVALGITVGVLYAVMDGTEREAFISGYLYGGRPVHFTGVPFMQAVTHSVCKGVFALLILPVLVWGSIHIHDFNRLVNAVYADTEEKDLTSVHHMLVAFVVTSLVSFAANVIGRQMFDEPHHLLAIPSTLFSVLLFAIGYIGHHQQFSIEDVERDEQRADNDVPIMPATTELRRRIEHLMETQELYRRQNLKIVDLVSLLHSNRNYVFQAINREMNMSFNEYVNRLRVDYAEREIKNDPAKPLYQIGEQAGFASSTSFYRNFKLYKGIGPKDFQQQAKEGIVS